MSKQISDERKVAYYIGLGLQLFGGLVFVSSFFNSLVRFGDFSDFQTRARTEGIVAFVGIALIFVGRIVAKIAAKGWAGSGIVLDPEKAREDLEPYSRMAGGMVKDAIDEAEINLGGAATKVIMLKCGSCKGLNQDSAKYCQECGAKL